MKTLHPGMCVYRVDLLRKHRMTRLLPGSGKQTIGTCIISSKNEVRYCAGGAEKFSSQSKGLGWRPEKLRDTRFLKARTAGPAFLASRNMTYFINTNSNTDIVEMTRAEN